MSASDDHDNTAPPASRGRMVPIIGFVGDEGLVTITHPAWRARAPIRPGAPPRAHSRARLAALPPPSSSAPPRP